MFPFKHGGELSFQVAGNNDKEEEEEEEPQQQHLVVDDELLAAVNLYTTTSSGATPCRAEDDRRKMVHRDIERQRRHEMSSLFSNLRSLLPPNYLKGKRSMSDHIEESVKYIKQLEVRIKDLGERRANLSDGDSNCKVEILMANNTSGTLQVQISSGNQQGLSRVLKVLLEARLDVVSCVTNKLDATTLLHSIHCQVIAHTGSPDVDLQQLQQRLYEALIAS